MTHSAGEGSPIACNLDAFSPAERQRHAALLAKLGSEMVGAKELPDGYAFQFAPEPRTVADVAEWITLERACCPFLTFAIEIEPGQGPLWLRLTGEPRVKEFIRMEFAATIHLAKPPRA